MSTFRLKTVALDYRYRTAVSQSVQTSTCITLLYSTAKLLDGFETDSDLTGLTGLLRRGALAGKLNTLDKAVRRLKEDKEVATSTITADIAALAKEMREKANELYGGDVDSDDPL